MLVICTLTSHLWGFHSYTTLGCLVDAKSAPLLHCFLLSFLIGSTVEFGPGCRGRWAM